MKRLAVEQLEKRELFAGDVTAAVQGQMLVIGGDADANGVVLTYNSAAQSYRVSGTIQPCVPAAMKVKPASCTASRSPQHQPMRRRFRSVLRLPGHRAPSGGIAMPIISGAGLPTIAGQRKIETKGAVMVVAPAGGSFSS